jgi:hypothetical protein
MKAAKFLSVLTVLGVSGCGGPIDVTEVAQVETQLVAVSEITKSIKCSLSRALEHEFSSGGISRLTNRIAVITYTFQLVDTTKIEGNIGATKAGPFVFAFAGGTGSVLPKLSGSVDRTNTVTTTIDSTIPLVYRDLSACIDTAGPDGRGRGFDLWLARVVEQLDASSAYPPVGVVTSLHFVAQYGVMKKGGAGVDVDLVFLSGSADGETSRNDVQTLDIRIRAKKADDVLPPNIPVPPNTGPGLGPFKVGPQVPAIMNIKPPVRSD